MNRASFIIISVFAILLSSCSKKIVPLGPIPERNNSEVLDAISNHNIDWEWFAIKAGTKVSSPNENVSGTSYMRMRKDSVIWVVAKKLNAEVTRNLITKDSIHILYRFEQIYERGSIRDLKRHYNINMEFEDIQQLMFGNVIIPDSSMATISKENNLIRVDAIDEDLFLSYWLNPYDLHLAKIKISDHLKRDITAEFSDYRKISSGYVVPYYRNITMPADEGATVSMILEIKKIEINIPKTTKFEVPAWYEIY